MDFPSMEERGSRGDFHILKSIWLADLPEPVEFLEVFEGRNPNNLTGWTSPEYDSLLEWSRRTLDRELRFDLLRRAEYLLLTDMPIIPLLQYANVQLIKPYISGLEPNPLDVIGWTGIRVDTEWLPPK
jgi:oligopeptide transport system substrate-binding protein